MSWLRLEEKEVEDASEFLASVTGWMMDSIIHLVWVTIEEDQVWGESCERGLGHVELEMNLGWESSGDINRRLDIQSGALEKIWFRAYGNSASNDCWLNESLGSHTLLEKWL